MPTNRFYTTSVNPVEFESKYPAAELFHSYLTDDGSDSLLNEDYSSTATVCYVDFTQPSVVQTLIIELLDSDIAQNAVLSHELFVGANAALTNGILIQVRNSAATVILQVIGGNAIKTLAEFDALSEYVDESSDVSNGTTAANHHSYNCRINFYNLFGKGIMMNTNDRFAVVLNDDFSGLAKLRLHIAGYRL